MKTPILLLTLMGMACGGGWAPQASGQTRFEPALPSGPLVATRAPETSQWVVTFKAQAASKPEAGKAATPAEPDGSDFQSVVTKSRTTYHIKITTGARFNVDKWCFQDIQITVLPNAQRPVISTADDRDDYYMDFSKRDFNGFEWIAGKNFTGMQQIAGVECMVFKDTLKGPSGESIQAQAVVDYKTRLPVSLQMNEGLTTYQFSPTQTSPLSPPAQVTAMAEQWKKRLRQARLTPPS